MATLANPIVVEQDNGTLIRLHCATPGERCNVDDARNVSRVPWAEALVLLMEAPTDEEMERDSNPLKVLARLLCVYCFER